MWVQFQWPVLFTQLRRGKISRTAGQILQQRSRDSGQHIGKTPNTIELARDSDLKSSASTLFYSNVT